MSSFPQSIPDPHFCVYELPFFSSRRGYLPGSFSFFNKVGPVGVGILINPRPCHFEPRVINQNLFSFLGDGRPFTPTRLMKKHNGISRKLCFFFFLKMPFSSPSLMGDLQPSKKVKGLGGRTSQCRYLISRASFPRKEISAVYEHRNGGDRKKVKCHLFPNSQEDEKKI